LIFWDASAIVPLLVPEDSSASVAEILLGDREMIVWWGTQIECESALARGERLAILSPGGVGSARQDLRMLSDGWTEIEPSDLVRDHAIALLRAHALRAADAIQLAAALVWSDGRPAEMRFMALDHRLAIAAKAEGFELALQPNEG
jgi:predicted nucleic acid-binding protein